MKGFLLAAAIMFATVDIGSAAVITVHGGGLTVVNFDDSTVGSEADPWLLEESVTGTGTLQWSGGLGGGVSGINQSQGKFLAITKWNNTGLAWTSFELELQVIPGLASGEGDGLSFAQGSGLTFTSDIFANLTRIDIERDYLNFSGGIVNPGESVTFFIAIGDNSANNPFYLLQTPNKLDRDPEVPEPSTWAMLLGGFGLFACRLRSRR